MKTSLHPNQSPTLLLQKPLSNSSERFKALTALSLLLKLHGKAISFRTQKARKWKLSTSLQIAPDQHDPLLADVEISSAKAECLVSLLDDVAESNQRLRYLHQRAVEENRALEQQSKQFASASKLALISNSYLIAESETYLKNNTGSYDLLLAEKEKSFQHAIDTKSLNKDFRVLQNQNLLKQSEELAIFIASLTIFLDTLESINALLLKHKDAIDVQMLEVKTTLTDLVQKRKPSNMSLLFKISCFR